MFAVQRHPDRPRLAPLAALALLGLPLAAQEPQPTRSETVPPLVVRTTDPAIARMLLDRFGSVDGIRAAYRMNLRRSAFLASSPTDSRTWAASTETVSPPRSLAV